MKCLLVMFVVFVKAVLRCLIIHLDHAACVTTHRIKMRTQRLRIQKVGYSFAATLTRSVRRVAVRCSTLR